MTEIILHGILAKEFGSNFEMKISRPKDIVKALDANFPNFRNRVNELYLEGLNYIIIVDGKKLQDINELEIANKFKKIEMVPLIFGSGIVAVGTAILSTAFVSTSIVSAAAMTAFLGTALGAFTAALVGGIALAAITIGLQMLLAPKPEKMEAIRSSTSAIKESFAFSNKANLANQGAVIPIGYGRLKVGSQVIQNTVKSYQSQISFDDIARQFNATNTDSISTKHPSDPLPVIPGTISGKLSSTSFGYILTWTTKNVTELTLNGKKVNLNSNGGADTLFFNLIGLVKGVNNTFVLYYQGGQKTVKTTKTGNFSG